MSRGGYVAREYWFETMSWSSRAIRARSSATATRAAASRSRSAASRCSSTSDGLGHGLVGVRERVKIYGGERTAGGIPEGGFVLNMRLPVVEYDH